MIALAVLLFIVAALMLTVAAALGSIARDRRHPVDRPFAVALAAACVLSAGIVITGGVKLW